MDGGSGLTFTEFRVDPMLAEFGPWHSGEHVGERLAVPGVLSARRYVCIDDPQSFIGYYRAERWEVFTGEAYRALFANASEGTKRVLASVKGTRFVGEIVRETRSGYGGYACYARLDGAQDDDARVRWFDAAIGGMLATPGIAAAALALPRRELDHVSDPNVIALIEGYDLEALKALGRSSGGAYRLLRLEHLFV